MFCVDTLCVGRQRKLEGELQQIEEKHRAKKCKFAESSEQFYEQLARVSCRLVAYLLSSSDHVSLRLHNMSRESYKAMKSGFG